MNAPLQRDIGIPLYLQVSEILMRQILNGKFAPGSSLAAEPDLCVEFGVARGTIRQALAKLEVEGFVRREQGRGTFITWGELQVADTGLTGSQIGLVVPYVRDSFVSTILLGAERAATEHDLSITFKHAENNLDRQNKVLEDLVSQQMAGIILYPVNSLKTDVVEQLVRSSYPLVLVDRYLRGLSTDYVMSDQFGGALRAMQHLIGLGHTHIGLVSWRDPSVSLEQRAAGYRQALIEAGLPYDPALMCEVEGYPSVAVEPLREFLSDTPQLSAVFAVNDQLALAVYKSARELGLRIPDDLAVVGFDNLDFTMHLDVPLTTIEQPAQEMGYQAVEALVRRINGTATTWQQLILPTRLIIRQSCGAEIDEAALDSAVL
ncbi:GntR family transcriptional regulator [Aggregatilinea lenta]|uniref:GntR family transcriptional regulator n=1 Tax=Aggregatilinea lenta TaxID=913108 RepID=UPI000E5C3EDC|nr:GntR family transcriptional regulator [Aggregatilinea lenta]